MVCISVVAPILFSAAGAPNLLLGIAVIALAAAGIITAIGAVSAQRRRQADGKIRLRAHITASGITFYRQPQPAEPEFFSRDMIKRAWLTDGALIIDTTEAHPKPGRHRLGFTKLATSRAHLAAVIAPFNQTVADTPP
jgi:hypothetical protein